MSTPNPTPEPDADKKKDEIARRLEALRGASESAATPNPAEALPNLPAQMLLVILSRLNANHVNVAKMSASQLAALGAELVEIRRQMVTNGAMIESVASLRGDLVTVNDRLVQMQTTMEEIAFRFLVGTVALVLTVVGLAVLVGTLLGSHR
jgi:hypothetical protein